jgi:hypothetical protein
MIGACRSEQQGFGFDRPVLLFKKLATDRL